MTKEEAFLDLAKQYERERMVVDSLREELAVAMAALGPDKYIQDPDTGAVYKIVKPLGTFTYYRDLDYKRTALDGERGGTVLSKKEAQEAGFDVK